MEEIKPFQWGESCKRCEYADTMQCLTPDCPRGNVRAREYSQQKYHDEIAIGVRFNGKRESRPYVLACECPACSGRFWFHISEDRAKDIFEQKKPRKLETLEDKTRDKK